MSPPLLLLSLISCYSPYLATTHPIEQRLSLADEWNSYYQPESNGPDTYSYGFDLEDPKSGNVQYRIEERYPNGTVIGSYGLLEPDGNVKVVKYVADEFGYRATVEDSNQKHPRHYPPLTSRVENRPQSKSPELIHGVQSSTGTFGQSIQEEHTPPKYQTSFTDDPFDSFNNFLFLK